MLRVDTGTLGRNAGVPTPDRAILELCAEVCGEHLTMGPDGHLPDHVAAGFGVAVAAAKAAGLKYLAQFENRQAPSIPLA